MQKILLFIDSLGSGGAQRQLLGLAKVLKDNGYDVTVAVYHDIPFYAPQLQEAGVGCTYIKNAHNPNPISRIYHICKFVKRYKPDCVIAYLNIPSLIMCIVKLVHNKFKLIVSERNTTQKLTFRDKLRFHLYRYADHIISNSFSQDEFIKSRYPRLAAKCKAIINFVDTDYFHPRQHTKSDENRFVVAASLLPSKNTLTFLKAVMEVRKKHRNFIVDWYGITDTKSPYYLECQKFIDANNLSSNIRLLPKTRSIRDEYQAADFFCLPSLYEGTPNALCEALSCGLPSICSDICDNPHYVINGKNGFLFNPHSPKSISDSIIKCLEMNNSDYLSFSECSRTIAEAKLPITKFTESYIELIESH